MMSPAVRSVAHPLCTVCHLICFMYHVFHLFTLFYFPISLHFSIFFTCSLFHCSVTHPRSFTCTFACTCSVGCGVPTYIAAAIVSLCSAHIGVSASSTRDVYMTDHLYALLQPQYGANSLADFRAMCISCRKIDTRCYARR